jgi:hypothetical protein
MAARWMTPVAPSTAASRAARSVAEPQTARDHAGKSGGVLHAAIPGSLTRFRQASRGDLQIDLIFGGSSITLSERRFTPTCRPYTKCC